MRAITDQLRAPHGVVLLVGGFFVLFGWLAPREPDDAQRTAAPRPISGSTVHHTPGGRFTVFQSNNDYLVPDDENHRVDIVLKDNELATIALVSTDSDGRQGNGDSLEPSVSDDGRFVAFRSIATNLVPGDTNRLADIFVKDMKTGRTTLVSVDPSGNPANGSSSLPSISSDGRTVTFKSWATNLVPSDTSDEPDFFARDLETATTRLAAPPD
jgi:hypothetical protein